MCSQSLKPGKECEIMPSTFREVIENLTIWEIDGVCSSDGLKLFQRIKKSKIPAKK